LLALVDNYDRMRAVKETSTKEKQMAIYKSYKTAKVPTFKMAKRIIKAQFGWIVEIINSGKVVRRFECSTMEEARRCE
jgi:hypothetical protein